MKRNILAILFLCVSLWLCACGTAPEKSVPESDTEAMTETDTEIIEALPETDMEGTETAPETDTESALAATYDEPEAASVAASGDFGTLAGNWRADDGGSILTIYGNGGFELNQAEDTYEGYLVYTEADGGLWESGPRYELYLENNERVPDCYFALDDAYPGKLTYAVGGGAELFSRGDSAYDENGVTVRVQWADDALTDYDEFVAYSGDDEVGIVFSAERVLKDFKALSISLEGADEDGLPVFSVLELYAQEALTPERPLVVRTSFPGDMPTNGISYADDDGQTRYFSVGESGFDGSLILSEFSRSETP